LTGCIAVDAGAANEAVHVVSLDFIGRCLF